MVAHIPDNSTKPTLLSLPRDSQVAIPGHGKNKINAAFSLGGPKLLAQTVEGATGLHIDHYAEINLYGFSEITKSVGGVPVCLNESVHDKYSGAYFPAGKQTLKGVDALKFVRQRHGLPNGDLDRVRRQQAFLAGLALRVFSAGTLTDPGKVTSLVDSLTDAVVLDKNWDLVSFAQQLQGLTGDRIRFFTIPTIRPDLATPGDGSAVEVDPAQVRSFVQGLLDDRQSTGKTEKPDPPTKGKTRIIVQPVNQTADEQPIDASEVPCVN
jgi:LCP family protein required for cell wall assembly